MTVVLVLSPHPDDESIGCGGTLRRHVVEGDDVHVVFLTSGEAGGHAIPPQEAGRVREAEAEAAGRVLGTHPPVFLREPDGALASTAPLRDRLTCLLQRLRPAVLYVPHAEDAHPDHRAAHQVARDVLRGLPLQTPLVVRCFEVWTPITAIAEVVDVSPWIDTKLEAIRAHRSQCAVVRFDDAAAGLARYRGELHSWPGGAYAEVFARMVL